MRHLAVHCLKQDLQDSRIHKIAIPSGAVFTSESTSYALL